MISTNDKTDPFLGVAFPKAFLDIDTGWQNKGSPCGPPPDMYGTEEDAAKINELFWKCSHRDYLIRVREASENLLKEAGLLEHTDFFECLTRAKLNQVNYVIWMQGRDSMQVYERFDSPKKRAAFLLCNGIGDCYYIIVRLRANRLKSLPPERQKQIVNEWAQFLEIREVV